MGFRKRRRDIAYETDQSMSNPSYKLERMSAYGAFSSTVYPPLPTTFNELAHAFAYLRTSIDMCFSDMSSSGPLMSRLRRSSGRLSRNISRAWRTTYHSKASISLRFSILDFLEEQYGARDSTS
ncbi:unnamed protein product [Cuscuta campestris]|uniref:Uncharacterized protein n=1 Tax=Cuscuta campestris TaxID=132261 RepID=A0A484LU74_9ASTE|nr:unnamed protein product [Cuscuta campestris]